MRFSVSFADFLSEVGACDVEGEWRGEIQGISTLKEAQEGDLSFLGNSKYTHDVSISEASVILVPASFEGKPKPGQTYIRLENPSFALSLFCRDLEKRFWPRPPSGIHPTATIDRDASVHETASVGPYCLVSAGAKIGANAVLMSHVSLGYSAVVGEGSCLLSQVTVGHFCEIGREVILNPGVVIGADGFGYETANGVHYKVPQIGAVIIEDHVEIGANTTIDRARFDETRIGEGTKIDNLVQIGHNVRIGKHCLIVAQVGISGSTTLEDFVVIGGQSGVVGHITIGKGTQVAAQSGVSKNIAPGSVIQGSPTVDIRLYRKISALQRKLPDLFKRFNALEQKEHNPSS